MGRSRRPSVEMFEGWLDQGYRGMMGSIFSNMSTPRGSGTNAQTTTNTLMDTMTANLLTIQAGQR